MNVSAQIAAVILAGFVGNQPMTEDDLLSTGSILTSDTRQKPQIIEISDRSCSYLADHMTRQDVIYQPFQTLNGKPVVPANLNSSGILTSEDVLKPVYEFDVKIGPLFALVPFNDIDLAGTLTVATVQYNPSKGEVTLNGRKQIWLHQTALSEACANRHGL